ncbi:MAG: DUF554 domain-containing protein [Eubacteriales bacterium]|nr:DUF554 domain-containing protein [Eubacteriales bacterium]
MTATVVNALAIIIGGLIGSVFGNKIKEKYTKNIMLVMAMIVAIIGIQGAVAATDILALVICCVLGTVIGTALKLDDAINSCGDKLKSRLSGTVIGKGSIGDAFVTATLLFGVGTMAILGSIQAGINKDYGILFTKSVMDFVSAIAFSAAMGPGVIFSAIPIFVFQGAITLLAGVAEPYLTKDVITAMSAAGGPIFMGMAVNMLELREERVKIGDMLPAIFMPIIYLPLAELLKSLF